MFLLNFVEAAPINCKLSPCSRQGTTIHFIRHYKKRSVIICGSLKWTGYTWHAYDRESSVLTRQKLVTAEIWNSREHEVINELCTCGFIRL